MPKNIVVFSDGTGQEGGKGYNTNIYKMFNMIEDRTDTQVAFYDRGLGTGFRKFTGNIGGMGISRNIKDCYRFMFENYEAGDQIFLFGFSRGAATVRSLSAFIHHFGVLPKSRPELIDQAYRIYKSRASDREIRAKEFVARHHTMWTSIRFLGCYDTVAALGLPIRWLSALLDGIPGFRHRFHNFALSEAVEYAYQALAIDDERRTFHPILWDADKRVRQVWFCGMHTDVGGGYKEQELSDVPLVWMTDMAFQKGLRIYTGYKVPIKEDTDGFMHNSRERGIGKIYRRKVRYWPEGRKDKLVVHESVLRRVKNRNNTPNPEYTSWVHPYLETGNHEEEPWVSCETRSWCNQVDRS